MLSLLDGLERLRLGHIPSSALLAPFRSWCRWVRKCLEMERELPGAFSQCIFPFFFVSWVGLAGLGIAVGIRVGNALGRGAVADAKLATYATIILSCVWIALNVILVVAMRHLVVGIFTSDEDVRSLTVHVLPILAIFGIGDTFQAVTAGVLRGAFLSLQLSFVISHIHSARTRRIVLALFFPATLQVSAARRLELVQVWCHT